MQLNYFDYFVFQEIQKGKEKKRRIINVIKEKTIELTYYH